ncbi:hypothetical protein Ddc_13698 [Ditylenchus destructor]|nr:hypothetical protein Ddc_13698 [Ditylenchus destructor]
MARRRAKRPLAGRILKQKSQRTIRSLAQRIERKVVRYAPLPRVPPFYCQKCGLSSKHLDVLVSHVCSKKMVGFSEHTNLSKLVQLGFRSKVKDAYAVLERIPNPQSVKVSKLKSVTHINLVDKFRNPPTLSEIAFKAVENAHLQFNTIVSVTSPTPPNPKIQEEPQQSTEEKLAKVETDEGFVCQTCSRLFGRFFDYDQHLEDSEECGKSADPIEVQVSPKKLYPKAGKVIPSSDQKESASNADDTTSVGKWECTKCGKNDFAQIEELHEHIFECALDQ